MNFMRHILITFFSVLLLIGSIQTGYAEEEKQKKPSPPPNFNAGMAAYKAKDYATALMVWNTLAEKGNAHAQYMLGNIYMEPGDATKNPDMAIKWYTLAAEQDHTAAQSTLGLMYLYGSGVERDAKLAVKWLLRTAKPKKSKANKDNPDELAEEEEEPEEPPTFETGRETYTKSLLMPLLIKFFSTLCFSMK